MKLCVPARSPASATRVVSRRKAVPAKTHHSPRHAATSRLVRPSDCRASSACQAVSAICRAFPSSATSASIRSCMPLARIRSADKACSSRSTRASAARRSATAASARAKAASARVSAFRRSASAASARAAAASALASAKSARTLSRSIAACSPSNSNAGWVPGELPAAWTISVRRLISASDGTNTWTLPAGSSLGRRRDHPRRKATWRKASADMPNRAPASAYVSQADAGSNSY